MSHYSDFQLVTFTANRSRLRAAILANQMTSETSLPSLDLGASAARERGASLNAQLVLRRLEIGDFDKGFPAILSQLTQVGDISKEMFCKRFQEMKACGDTYHVMVIEDTTKSKIIAAATLILEIKFIRNCGKIGHIEDVVVDKTYRGHNLGIRVIQGLIDVGKQLGCYKVILDCSAENMSFYEKLGFADNQRHMALYFDKQAQSNQPSQPNTAPPPHQLPIQGSSPTAPSPILAATQAGR